MNHAGEAKEDDGGFHVKDGVLVLPGGGVGSFALRGDNLRVKVCVVVAILFWEDQPFII